MTIKVTYNVTDVYVTQDVSPVYINVSYSSGSSGGSAVWGGITGTLSDQTDLQSALDLKVPYSGATANVNLGEYEIKAGQVTLDTSPTGTAAVGTTRWNDTLGSTETTLKGGSVILKNGVDLVARVVNKVSPNTTLTKAAYQAVRVSGAQGQRLAVAFAQANNDNNSADTIGLVIETIATNQEGFIMTVGQIEGINTTGSLQGETWADGDVLYLSPTTAGALTNVKPNATIGHIVVIGYVEYAHANNGKIYVKVMNGWELGELHDVYVPTPSNNDVLTYETSSGLWKNKSVGTALGYTPANSATTLTINGVTYDLSTSRTWTISTGISGSGASGQVSYWDGTTSQAGSNNLFWDAANGRLGIGTSSPAYALDISGTANYLQRIRNSSGTGAAALIFNNTSNDFYVGIDNSTGSAITGTAYARLILGIGAYPLIFGTNSVERARFFAGGNFALGSTSDSGQRLQVSGDTLLKGSGTNVLLVENSDGSDLIKFVNNGWIDIGNAGSGASMRIFPFTTTYGSADLSGRNLQFLSYATTQSAIEGAFYFTGINFSQTSGAQKFVNIANGFTPTSGTATFTLLNLAPTINQTGGANGITRGLYVAPILTAAGDWRSIEWSNNSGWGLYGAGTAANYIAGNLLLGASTPNSGERLQVTGTSVIKDITTSSVASALLQLSSTTKGFLPPRMTTTQKNAIASPAAGLVVYDTTDNKHYGYNGTTWNAFY